MNMKPVLRYQLRSYFSILSKIYGFFYALLVATVILRYTSPNGAGDASGIETWTMIAVFILGLVLFKSAFRFFSSYGVSRKRLFCGLTAALGITAAAVSALDMINTAVFSHFIRYNTFYEALIGAVPGSRSDVSGIGVSSVRGAGGIVLFIPTVSLLLKNWLWCLLVDFIFGMLGFFIAALYYRMGKTLKICVSVGVPAAFIALIQLDQNVAGGRIGAALTDFSTLWVNWGMNPGLDLVTRLVPIALLAGCIWLLLRKAEVKAA